MQFHSRLRQAIDGNSLQMKVISFHLLSIKRGAMLIYSRRQMHSSAAETEIASPVGGWESVAFLSLTIKANTLCCGVIQRMVFRRESKFIKYSTAVPDKYWLFWGEVFVASLRDLRARRITALSQQRAAVLKNAGLRDYIRVTFTLYMVACDEVTFTNDPWGQLFEYLVLAWAEITLKLYIDWSQIGFIQRYLVLKSTWIASQHILLP